MTLTDLIGGLEAICPSVFEDAAPVGIRPCIVCSVYGSRSVPGDDRTQVRILKVQLDLLTLSSLDPLLDRVAYVLGTMALPWSIQSNAYDPDYGCFRSVVQVEVL